MRCLAEVNMVFSDALALHRPPAPAMATLYDIDHIKQNAHHVAAIKQTVFDSGLCEQQVQSLGLTASGLDFLVHCDNKPLQYRL